MYFVEMEGAVSGAAAQRSWRRTTSCLERLAV